MAMDRLIIIIKFYLVDQIQMKVRRAYRRVDRNSVEVYYTPVDNDYEADIILTATIEDR